MQSSKVLELKSRCKSDCEGRLAVLYTVATAVSNKIGVRIIQKSHKRETSVSKIANFFTEHSPEASGWIIAVVALTCEYGALNTNKSPR